MLVLRYIIIIAFSPVVNSKNLKLLVLSDWGKGGKSGTTWSSVNARSKSMELLAGKTNQWLVAQAMGNYVDQTDLKPSALLALGDNFYVNGISSSIDSK
mmetsp:Transcript_10540/g.9459  ORF Transcript_10540/g.9459 Transcript_10540/m.9459 type:complete len:99 (-) Transcript_10540:1758-2054(-)